MTREPSRFEMIGGEAKLRAIIDDFVERIFSDMMIGFFFGRASKQRIRQMEYEHAAQWLGADVVYSGQPLDRVHAKHGIMGGQFARRRKLLENTLRDHGVDDVLIADWLAHQDALRAQITGDEGSACGPARKPPNDAEKAGDME